VQVFERTKIRRLRGITERNLRKDRPDVYSYKDLVGSYDFDLFREKDFLPTIIPNWDNTPRSGKKGWAFNGSTPEAFAHHAEEAIKFVMERPNPLPKILFIKSWNEWAEGNYLEPDQRYGLKYLEELNRVIRRYR
jgi:hypothetical protein